MANTTKLVGRFLQIKGLDADWSIPGDMATFRDAGLRVKSIMFYPSAAADICVIKAGTPAQKTTVAAIATTATAAQIFAAKADATPGTVVKYFGDTGQTMWPFIDISDWTLGTAANARLEIELA